MSATSTELMLNVSLDLNANSSEELRPIEAHTKDEHLIPYYRLSAKLNRLKRIYGHPIRVSAKWDGPARMNRPRLFDTLPALGVTR
jgi:hypothetical protein